MPELPEVESARLFLEEKLKGKKLSEVTAAKDEIICEGVEPKVFKKTFTGRTVESLHRRGKHMWLVFDKGPCLYFHLGMTGRFMNQASGSPAPRFWKMKLSTHELDIYFLNKRRLGRIRIQNDPKQEPPVSKLGWDPVHDPMSPIEFRELLLKRKAPIKGCLLNQQLMAGVGNWIADEALYQSQIHPATRASHLSKSETDKLLKDLKRIILFAIKVRADDKQFPKTWLFHHRWGKAKEARTVKGESIEYLTVAGRTSAFVPVVQELK